MKRTFDVAVAAFVLIISLPVLMIIFIGVRLDVGAPALFKQIRPGLNGKPFQVIKFRTMRDAVDDNGDDLPDVQRLTGFGRFLRSTSLDEIPQFWNIMKGEMSLVGPRPLLIEYLSFYSPEQARRHEVRPGITGWAQVNGRNAISWDEKFALDIWYVDHQSFCLDLKIIWLTVCKVLKREGISAVGEVTMPKFDGGRK